MALTYRVHPTIGIARVGNSDEFFLAPERVEGSAIEFDAATGAEHPLANYKKDGKVKRQAARFRVFEHDDTGSDLTSVREITDAEAEIKWKVVLANKKGASPQAPVNTVRFRNAGEAQSSLELVSTYNPIGGPMQREVELTKGSFMGLREVSLGELRTDPAGRLIVIGGKGEADRVRGDRTEQMDFANNDDWYDDTSDGSVIAEITIRATGETFTTPAAWVVVSTPDYAPEARSIATLFDVAKQVAIVQGTYSLPDALSFEQHIKPIIEKAIRLGQVGASSPAFDNLPSEASDMAQLADNSAGNASFRQEVRDRLFTAFSRKREFMLPQFMASMLEKWEDGDFASDLGVAGPVFDSTQPVTAAELDFAALDQTVGGGFLPGIEYGAWSQTGIYDFDLIDGHLSPRLNPAKLNLTETLLGVTRTIDGPGFMTARMAIPWQADFLECAGRQGFISTSLWWPAQRPDRGRDNTNAHVSWLSTSIGAPGALGWPRGSHQNMVDQYHRHAVLREERGAAGDVTYVETERDPTLPR